MAESDFTIAIPSRGQMDPFDYARALFDSMRSFVDARNTHRRGDIDTIGRAVANCEVDLARGKERPGWVQITFDQYGEDVGELKSALGEDGWVRKAFNANAEAIKAQNRKLNAILVAVGLALLGLLGNLVAVLIGAYS